MPGRAWGSAADAVLMLTTAVDAAFGAAAALACASMGAGSAASSSDSADIETRARIIESSLSLGTLALRSAARREVGPRAAGKPGSMTGRANDAPAAAREARGGNVKRTMEMRRCARRGARAARAAHGKLTPGATANGGRARRRQRSSAAHDAADATTSQ